MKRLYILLIVAVCFASQAFAQIKVTANIQKNAPAHAMFGWSVAIDGDYAAITAPNECYDDVISGGAVYLFQKNGDNWSMVQRLAPDDPHTMKLFGLTVSMHNSLLAIGCPNDNGKMGSVYLYRLDNGSWKFSQQLLPSGEPGIIEFGVSLDIGDHFLMVGTGGTKGDNTASGSVYLFSEIDRQFVEVDMFESPDESVEDLYASDLQAVTSSQFLVSAPRAHGQAENSGAVYSYIKDGDQWILHQKIISPREISEGFFGCSISFSENRLLVGAFQERSDTIISGAAYYYRLNDMQQLELIDRILPKDASDHDYFGLTVLLNGDQAIVSSPKYEHDRAHGDIGCVDVFTVNNEGWELEAKILPDDGGHDDHFGMALDACDNDLLIGSRFNDNMVANNGASYFYSIRQVVGMNQQILTDKSSMVLRLFPNPFLDESTLFYQLAQTEKVSIKVYDVKGQVVCCLMDKSLPAGLHQISWDGRDDRGQSLPGGIYSCQINAGNDTESFQWIKAQ